MLARRALAGARRALVGARRALVGARRALVGARRALVGALGHGLCACLAGITGDCGRMVTLAVPIGAFARHERASCGRLCA